MHLHLKMRLLCEMYVISFFLKEHEELWFSRPIWLGTILSFRRNNQGTLLPYHVWSRHNKAIETRGNPRLWVRLPALAGIVHDWGETLEQVTEPPTAPRTPHSRLPTAPGVCALGWVKCRENMSLLIILCIIVYVTNKAHLSLICIVYLYCI